MKRILTLAILVLACSVMMAQNNSPYMNKGDKMIDKFNYEDALYFYQLALEAEGESPDITRRIARTYRKLGELQMSSDWYAKTLHMDDSNPEDMLFYAEALKCLQMYDEAMDWYIKYADINPHDLRAQSHVKDPEYFKDLQADSIKYRIKSLDLNTDKAAFGVCSYGDRYLFSSSGVNPDFEIDPNLEDENAFLDIYACQVDFNDEFILAEKISGNINSKYHDGPAFFDELTNTMFITRNNMQNGKPVRDKNGNVNLKIFSSQLYKGMWSPVEPLALNNDEYSTGHPCVTPDGTILVFVSNMPGGFGGTDLYMAKNIAGTWANPVNLGPTVNTEGDEMFPNFSDDGALYFASDGHAGLGGLDIFRSEPMASGWDNPKNLGFPINTNHDDFSILYNNGDESGYFASNRVKKGSDDIFFFSTLTLRDQIVAGTIESRLPGIQLAGEKIEVQFAHGGAPVYVTLDSDEAFEINVPAGDRITAYMTSDEFDSEQAVFSYKVMDEISDPYVNIGMHLAPMASMQASQVEQIEPSQSSALAQSDSKKLAEQTTRDMLMNLKDNVEEIESDDVNANSMDTDDGSSLTIPAEATAEINSGQRSLSTDMSNIYFVYDESYIGISAAGILDQIVVELNAKPTLNLEIDTHCDSRGTDDYNEQLSRDRAMSILKYLVWKGVSKDRLSLNWHGEEDLVNTCDDEVKCSSDEHQANRRAEFRISEENVAAITK